MAYQGQDTATPERVRRYLLDNYHDSDDTALSQARLTGLLADHAGIVERGVELHSYTNYVGDQIAAAAGLNWSGHDGEGTDAVA